MAALADQPTAPATQRKSFFLNRWLIAAVALIVLVVGSIFGWRAYVQIRQERLVGKARALLEAKNYSEAMLSTQWALTVNSRDLGATRLMAELADIAGSSQAVFWHRTVAELEPGVLENHLKWAEAGLRSGNHAMAEQALANVNEAGKKTAAFHEVAARVAQALNKAAEAEQHFAQAVKLEPGSEKFRFGLATARLESTDPATRDEARATVEQFRTNPDYRRRAHRVLIQDHFRRSQWKEGFLIAAELQATADASFEDRMLLLDLLRRFQRPELHAYLMDVQETATRRTEHVTALLNWLNRNTMALIAADWSKSLPLEIRDHHHVTAAIAEAYVNLKDWARLRPVTVEGDWKEDDFMRLALFARVLREEGDELASRTQWNAAISAASGRPEALERLARFADGSRWDIEKMDLLWQVARGVGNPHWALATLRREYYLGRNTRGCLNVATRMLELDPRNAFAQNDVASFSVLLDANMERALALAKSAYTKEPGNPVFATTYAFVLHVHGRTGEGIKLMRTIDPRLLARPAFAAYFGVLLADYGDPREARTHLDIAQTGKFLPEERKLINDAHDRLRRRVADEAASTR